MKTALRTFFLTAVVICALAGDWTAAMACGFFWGLTQG